MTNLSAFSFNNQELRIFLLGNVVWFVAKDVASILGYSDTSQAIRQHIETEDTLTDVELTKKAKELGQSDFNAVPRAVYTNESGVYYLIFGSTRPEAKAFKRWLATEVLPEIQKTGGYTHKRAITPPSSFDALEYAKKALSLCGLESPIVESWGLVTLASKIDTPNREIYLDAQKLIASHIELPEVLSTVTEVCTIFEGNGVKMTARDLNKMLCKLGLQVLTRDAKGRIQYQLTESSQELGKLTLTSTNGGKNIPQLRWYANKLIRAIGDRIK